VSLRRRLALLSALAVALAVLLASGLVYALVRDRLRGDIDNDLKREASRATARVAGLPGGGPTGAGVSASGATGAEIPVPPPGGGPPPGGIQQTQAPPTGEAGETSKEQRADLVLPPPAPGAPQALVQLITNSGQVLTAPGSPLLIPVSGADQQLASHGGKPNLTDTEANGTSLRVLTQPLPQGGAIQLARSLEDTNHTLSTLIIILAAVSAGGIALAAALGPVVARTALAPAGEVSDAAEEVARTHDLSRRIEVRGDDELGRLAASFNEMMQALERSEGAQRRLVADASHELRTPMATLRTNIETLGRSERIDPEERRRLVEDLTDELEEMSELVGDVVELAREPGQGSELAQRDVDLGELARDALERAKRRARGLRFDPQISRSLVHADPQRLGRAISNLLDNACKWSPPGGTVEVEVADGRVAVRDHGPGFAPADLDKVFDRFWRADEARGKPGSGLGLAIVQRIAEEHGGSAQAANANGGGAMVSLELPEVPQEPS
jgi:two-component system, OmpR family, sensor histidine kinase MprB